MNYNKRSAFTLIELLIVIGITAVVAMAVVPSFLQGYGQMRAKNATNEVVMLINNTRNRAISGWSVVDPDATIGAEGADLDQAILPRHLGVKIIAGDNMLEDKFSIFADLDGDTATTEEQLNLDDFVDFEDLPHIPEIMASTDGLTAVSVPEVTMYFHVPTGEVALYDNAGNLIQWARFAVAADPTITPAFVAFERDASFVRDIAIKAISSFAFICEANVTNEIACNTELQN